MKTWRDVGSDDMKRFVLSEKKHYHSVPGCFHQFRLKMLRSAIDL